VTKRIGTTIFEKCGGAYLLASQDARQADCNMGRLLEAFWQSRFSKPIAALMRFIDDVASGKFAYCGYNLLGFLTHTKSAR